MDLCGPIRVESINGKKYVLVIVDDYSRYTWTHFLRSKDETPGVLIDFLTLVQRGLHAQVTTVRTDKGTEFLNKTLHAYFAKEGIRHETSTARTPEQNGAEAIATTCFTQNRSLVIPQHEKTPYHIINARKPSVKFFHIFGSLCYIVRDGENLDKMKEKGDACIFVGYSTQSKAYRVFNKRTRMIVETIHVNFDELPQMASDHVSSDPGPQCSTTVLEQDSLSPGPQSQENVPQVAETVTTSNELELLYSPMFSELLNGNSPVVSKSSAVHAADNPDKRQQHNTTHTSTTTDVADPPPLNIHSTHQTPTQVPTVTAPENIIQAETNTENAQFDDDEFINIFSTPVQEQGETSSRHVDSSNMHTFYQHHPSAQRWTKDHPLEQVIGNPSQSVRTRRQLETDGEMCMFALTVSQTEPKNIKEAMADSAWIESMQEELHQFDRLLPTGMSSTSKVGLGYEIKSNDKVLSYEEEMNRTVFNCTEEDFIDKPLYSRFSKTDIFKRVPHPLTGDYTPKPQQEIDESLYVYGKKGPQKPKTSVSGDTFSKNSVTTNEKGTPKVNGKYWNEMMERELGEGHSFIEKSVLFVQPKSLDQKIVIFMERKCKNGVLKKQKGFLILVMVWHKPVWNNANRVNHANHFVPRPVQLIAVRQNVNSVRPNVNTGRANVNSVRQNVNSVKTNVNTGSFNINIVRAKQPIHTSNSNSFSPVRPQVNKFNQRNNFSKSHSPVRRPIVSENAANKVLYHPVKGNWGTAVKTSAGHMTGNKDHLDDFEECKGGSVTFGGSKGYITGKGKIRVGTSEVTNSAGTLQTPNANASEEEDEAEELIVVPTAVRHTASKVRPRKSSTNSKAEEFLTELQNLKTQEKEAYSTGISEDTPEILAFRRELDELAPKHLREVPKNKATSTTLVNSGSGLVNTQHADQDDSDMPELTIFNKPQKGIFDEASYDDEGMVHDFNNLPIEVALSVQTRSRVQQNSGAHALVSYVQKQQRNNHKDQQHCLFAYFLSQEELKKISEALKDDQKYPLSKDSCQVMLKMKLLDGKMNEVCYKLLKMIEKQAGEAHNEDIQRNLKFISEDQVRGGLLRIIVNRLKSGSYRVKSGRHS
ncbi:retrovirus-related pol polyprotein from transposon TNT 1-94 [Tanacetum coccineum]